jgi:hypothetical protein
MFRTRSAFIGFHRLLSAFCTHFAAHSRLLSASFSSIATVPVQQDFNDFQRAGHDTARAHAGEVTRRASEARIFHTIDDVKQRRAAREVARRASGPQLGHAPATRTIEEQCQEGNRAQVADSEPASSLTQRNLADIDTGWRTPLLQRQELGRDQGSRQAFLEVAARVRESLEWSILAH